MSPYLEAPARRRRGSARCAILEYGEVSEWLKVPLSKSGRLKGLVGSNPTLSARRNDEGGTMNDEVPSSSPVHRSAFIVPEWRGRLVA